MNESGNRNLLVVGYGSIGKVHATNAALLGWETWVVDPARTDVRCFDNIAAVVQREPNITKAVIATPAETHLSVLDELMQRLPDLEGILIEKPLSDRSVKLRDKYGVPICFRNCRIGFNWRFNSTIQAIKRTLPTLGKLQVVQMSAREWMPQYGGDVLLQSGSHILDTARYLFGELEVVGANISNFGVHGNKDEAASILLRTTKGADVYLHVNVVNSDFLYDYTIALQGKDKSEHWEIGKEQNMHYYEMKAFLEDDDSILATYEDGVRNLELIEQVRGASKVGRGRALLWKEGMK